MSVVYLLSFLFFNEVSTSLSLFRFQSLVCPVFELSTSLFSFLQVVNFLFSCFSIAYPFCQFSISCLSCFSTVNLWVVWGWYAISTSILPLLFFSLLLVNSSFPYFQQSTSSLSFRLSTQYCLSIVNPMYIPVHQSFSFCNCQSVWFFPYLNAGDFQSIGFPFSQFLISCLFCLPTSHINTLFFFLSSVVFCLSCFSRANLLPSLFASWQSLVFLIANLSSYLFNCQQIRVFPFSSFLPSVANLLAFLFVSCQCLGFQSPSPCLSLPIVNRLLFLF